MIPTLDSGALDGLRAQLPARAAALAGELAWLDTLDVFPPPATAAAGPEIGVGVFNVERGTCFDGIVGLIRGHAALRAVDVWLLNEVDWGMARSGNRHVARELAAALGMGGVFGIEFLELSKGFGPERDAPGENTRSLHGNAILSRYPLRRPRLLRLPRRCEWVEPDQPRIGGRMALLAEIDLGATPLTLACVHLENRTAPEGRRAQLQALLDVLPAGPAVIGGDLNSATLDGDRPEELYAIPDRLRDDPQRLRRPQPYEPLFEAVTAAGFAVDPFNAAAVPTAVPMRIPDPTYWLKLDWIFGRGVRALSGDDSPLVIRAERDGARISDHDALCVRVSP